MPIHKPVNITSSGQVIAGLERLGTALRAQAWVEAFARGLTPTQGQVLTVLHSQAGQGLRLSDIADALKVTPATASEAVGSLVSKGLVKKVQSASDARAITLSLTNSGLNEALAVAQWPSFLLEAVDELPEPDRIALLRGVISIIGSLQRSGHIPLTQMCVNCKHFRANAHADERRPHHCQLLDAPIGDGDIRVHCPEHERAPEHLEAKNWDRLKAQRGKRHLPVRSR